MRVFIDTVDVVEIEKYAALGILSGVTTNPTFMKQAGYTNTEKLVTDIKRVIEDGEIHVEAWGATVDETVSKAVNLHTKYTNLVFKIPFTPNGIKAASILTRKQIACNMHLVFSPNQALIADQIGASYICPLVGRIDDLGYDGVAIMRDIRAVVKNTNIIASSIRHPKHVMLLAKENIEAITIPPRVLSLMIQHPLTDKGIELFK